jgi:hypothetical protein
MTTEEKVKQILDKYLSPAERRELEEKKRKEQNK